MANTLGGVTLPRLTVQEDHEDFVGGGITYAVDGTPHTSYVDDVTRRNLRCSYITYDEYQALLGVYRNAKGGAVALHLEEWGPGVYRDVIVTRFRAVRTPFGENGVWHSSGRTLDIECEEA